MKKAPKTNDWQEYLLALVQSGEDEERAIMRTAVRFHKYTLDGATINSSITQVRTAYYG